MLQSCNIDICERKSYVSCHCCKTNFCLNHLQEHHDLINSLIDEINFVNDQLMILDIEILINHYPQKFNKTDSDRNLYKQKYHTYSQYFVKRIDQLQSKITECIYEQDTRKDFDLSTLSSPFQTIICKNPVGSALASNNRRLLMDQRSNLHLFDQDLTPIKQFQWKNGFVRNMCWSTTLNSFILTTNNEEILLLNESITLIDCIQKQNWCSCTCSDTSLFLTTNGRGTNIFEFNLSSMFEPVQQWKAPHSCREHELIHDMVYNNQTLALIIEDSFSNMAHIELRLSTTLDRIWSIRPDIKCNLFQPAIRCCSLKSDEWLVIDSNNSRLFQVTNHGQIRSSRMYKSPPWNAVLYGSHILVIRTENSLNFHKI